MEGETPPITIRIGAPVSNTFFDSTEVFPNPIKVRLPVGKAARVKLTILDLEDSEAGFEVVIFDNDGYMISSIVNFFGHGAMREFDIPNLSSDTSAVYVLPLQAGNPNQRYSIIAST